LLAGWRFPLTKHLKDSLLDSKWCGDDNASVYSLAMGLGNEAGQGVRRRRLNFSGQVNLDKFAYWRPHE